MSVAQGVSSASGAISKAVTNPVGTANSLGEQAGQMVGGVVHRAESVTDGLTQAVDTSAGAIVSPAATAGKAMNAMKGVANSAAAQVKGAATGFTANFAKGYQMKRNGNNDSSDNPQSGG